MFLAIFYCEMGILSLKDISKIDLNNISSCKELK